jgi:hypothetical protein
MKPQGAVTYDEVDALRVSDRVLAIIGHRTIGHLDQADPLVVANGLQMAARLRSIRTASASAADTGLAMAPLTPLWCERRLPF